MVGINTTIVSLSRNAGKNILNAGIVSHLVIVVLQEQLLALEHKRTALAQRILDLLGSQTLNANVVGGILVRLAQCREGFLVVPFHHGADGGGIPHGADSLLEAEGIAGGAPLVAEAQAGVDVELLGKLGGRLGGADADEEDLAAGTGGSSWEDARLELLGVLPAQESSEVAEEGHDGHLVGDPERRARAPLGGQGDGLRVRGPDEGGGAQGIEDADAVCGQCCRCRRGDGTEGRRHVDEAARDREER